MNIAPFLMTFTKKRNFVKCMFFSISIEKIYISTFKAHSQIMKDIYQLSFQNNGYDFDDIYIYGQMEMNKADDWIISSEEIILDVMLTNGRFADIYKARYQPYNNNAKRNVVVKTLKSKNQYICNALLIVRYL